MKRDPRSSHPAIAAYREIARVYPAMAWYDDVIDRVGDEADTLTRWRAHIKTCIGRGWRPTNVVAMLETFPVSNSKPRADAIAAAADKWRRK